MIFNSFEFLLFFPIMVVGYFLISFKYRWLWLLLGSYYFYMAHEPELVILLLISTVVDYICGIRMASTTDRYKKWYLVLSIMVNIGILIMFKYLAFFTSSIEQFLNFFGITVSDKEHYGAYSIDRIILPVGISFYTFQTLSYTIDVYRGKILPERHFGKFALYVAFFPQLVAGPIERAGRLLPQLKTKMKPHIPGIKKGLIYMAWGFFLKVVVADRLGMYVDVAFSDPERYHGLPLFIGALFFGCQIYYDFSGYTAIAIGAAKIFGIDLIHNFNRPFFASSASEFWGRWHISFMQWLRDYLFIPLGGSRVNKLLILRNILIVFFIVGLWHGANWTFVIWGLLNGLLLIFELGTKNIRARIFRWLHLPKGVVNQGGWLFVIIFMGLSLVFFRSASANDALLYLENLLYITNWHINILDSYFELIVSFLLIATVHTIHFIKGNDRIHELVLVESRTGRWAVYLGYILVFVLFAINRQNAFIYFQF